MRRNNSKQIRTQFLSCTLGYRLCLSVLRDTSLETIAALSQLYFRLEACGKLVQYHLPRLLFALTLTLGLVCSNASLLKPLYTSSHRRRMPMS